MGGFLEKWARRPPIVPFVVKEPQHVEERALPNDEPVSAASTLEKEEGVPWAEWKAAALNRMFQDQGVTGLPGRIRTATIMHGAYAAHRQLPIDSDLDFGKGTTRPMSCAEGTAD